MPPSPELQFGLSRHVTSVATLHNRALKPALEPHPTDCQPGGKPSTNQSGLDDAVFPIRVVCIFVGLVVYQYGDASSHASPEVSWTLRRNLHKSPSGVQVWRQAASMARGNMCCPLHQCPPFRHGAR